MTYAVALQIFAVMLSLLSIGLIAMIAQHTHKPPRVDSPAPAFAIRLGRAPHWPETLLRGGAMGLLLSFVVLTITCVLIARI